MEEDLPPPGCWPNIWWDYDKLSNTIDINLSMERIGKKENNEAVDDNCDGYSEELKYSQDRHLFGGKNA